MQHYDFSNIECHRKSKRARCSSSISRNRLWPKESARRIALLAICDGFSIFDIFDSRVTETRGVEQFGVHANPIINT